MICGFRHFGNEVMQRFLSSCVGLGEYILQFSEEGQQRSRMAYRSFVHCEHQAACKDYSVVLLGLITKPSLQNLCTIYYRNKFSFRTYTSGVFTHGLVASVKKPRCAICQPKFPGTWILHQKKRNLTITPRRYLRSVMLPIAIDTTVTAYGVWIILNSSPTCSV
jgi:hypothetical protein